MQKMKGGTYVSCFFVAVQIIVLQLIIQIVIV